MDATRIRIGEILLKQGVINDIQLQQALAKQSQTGRKLGRTLIDMGMVEEFYLLNLLSQQLNIPLIDLRQRCLDMSVARKLPETLARRYRLLLLELTPHQGLIVMADPSDVLALDQVAKHFRCTMHAAVAKEDQVLDALDQIYQTETGIADLAEELRDEIKSSAIELDGLNGEMAESDAPVVRLLEKIFEEAVQAKSSDIHIEPDDGVLRIRKRVDGVLYEQLMKESNIAAALVVRLKLMAGLDISEKRLPQDGRFHLSVRAREIDVRLSTMPVQYGESVVLRILDQTNGVLPLDQVGLPKLYLQRLRHLIRRPHGLILVTGPTGSGKTTTLYGAVTELNEPNKKIITIEDPVEYRLPRINQVQINTKIGLDFSTVLRASLRQDPDVLLVGEIRDAKSAEIALRAAMTGHLVLSTLHTNDAITAALRLADMGVDPYLVATSLQAVIAQRLIRRVCESCSESYQASSAELAFIRARLTESSVKTIALKQGRGCKQCNDTGYRGRIGVFELLEINADMANALRQNNVAEFNQQARQLKGFQPLLNSALGYALNGLSSMEEVLKIYAQDETEEIQLDADMQALGALM